MKPFSIEWKACSTQKVSEHVYHYFQSIDEVGPMQNPPPSSSRGQKTRIRLNYLKQNLERKSLKEDQVREGKEKRPFFSHFT